MNTRFLSKLTLFIFLTSWGEISSGWGAGGDSFFERPPGILDLDSKYYDRNFNKVNCDKYDKEPELELQLADAILIATCRNPSLRKMKYEISEQMAMHSAAKSKYLPDINAGITISTFNKTTDYSDFPINNYKLNGASGGGNISLRWLIADFGGRQSEVDNAANFLEAALFGRYETSRSVAISVVENYLKARSLKASVNSLIEGERLAIRSLGNIEALHRGGVSSLSDTLLAKASVAQVQLKKFKLKVNFERQ